MTKIFIFETVDIFPQIYVGGISFTEDAIFEINIPLAMGILDNY
jgi:hypothetical protein